MQHGDACPPLADVQITTPMPKNCRISEVLANTRATSKGQPTSRNHQRNIVGPETSKNRLLSNIMNDVDQQIFLR
jgi:hypothetical protein